jgi:serine/threonine-protein kinase
VLHRDVSPQNILIGRDGVARLLDFGVAKSALAAGLTEKEFRTLPGETGASRAD